MSGLSSNLISKFVKATNDNKKTNKETIVYGTVKGFEYTEDSMVENIVVALDGTEKDTDGNETTIPVSSTVDVNYGDRVIVMIKNHTAVVTGNLTTQSANIVKTGDKEYTPVKQVVGDVHTVANEAKETAKKANESIAKYDQILTTKASISELHATDAKIENLKSDVVNFKTATADKFTATDGKIKTLESDNVKINEKLTAAEGKIEELETESLTADSAVIKDLQNNSLTSESAIIKDLQNNSLTSESAVIKDLQSKKLDVESAKATYANIDFSNIGEAAVKKILADSGLIRDIVIGTGTITGELVGVTISGDLIKGNTIVAEKLVVKGEDGLYYKLNTDGVTTEAEQTDYNSLNGSVIKAKSITATKISVDDLVAFDATIGGFKITEKAIYSGVKDSATNTTRGVYLDSEGQLSVGDSNNFLRYYKDATGNYILEISASNVVLGASKKSVATAISEVQESVDTSVKSVDVEYYLSTSTTSLSGGSWQTTAPEWVDGKYMWSRTKTTLQNGTILTSNQTCIAGAKGSTGAQGPKGDKGDTGEQGAQGIQGPKGDKGDTGAQGIQGLQGPKGDQGIAGPKGDTGAKGDQGIQGVQGEKGQTGAKGDTGATGTGVASITEEYYVSTSKTSQTGGSWSTTTPTWSSGKYIWTRSKIVYKDPASTVYTTPVCDSSWEAVNEIEIGGRNLVPGTSSEWKEATIAQWNGTIYKRTHCSEFGLKVGDTATFSVELEVTNKAGLRARVDLYSAATGETGKTAKSSETIVYKGTTGYSTVTFTVAEGKEYIWLAAQNYDTANDTTAVIERYRHVQLEKGNKATGWTPNPSDMATADSVEDAKNTAESANEKADEAKALIANLSDSIAMLVTDGNGTSLMTQTEDGWTFSTANMQKSINDTSESLSNLQNTLGDTNSTVDTLKQAVNDLGVLSEYIKITTYEDEPCIELGDADNDFKLLITNTRILFKEGSSTPAYITNQSLHIKKAVIEEEMQHGGYVWKVRNNGNLGLSWKGGIN